MAFEIINELEIDAPASVVWEVIVDLASYGEWNPFVPEASSSFVVGEPIEMRVQMFDSFMQPQRETVLDYVEGERFRYGVAGMPLGAIRSSRLHVAQPLGNGRCAYRSHFELSGWLAPLVELLLGARMKRGFDSMADALEVRAEMLHRERNEVGDEPRA